MSSFEELSATWNTVKSINANKLLHKDEIGRYIEVNFASQNTINTHALTAVDLRTNQYLYIDERIEQVTGYSRQEYEEKGPRFMFSKIPLNHKVGVIRSALHQNKLISSCNPAEIKDLVINREINIVDKRKTSRRILHQVLDHVIDSDNRIQAVISLQTQIGHLSAATNFKYYIFSRKKNEIIYPTADFKSKSVFTTREKQIILMVAKGLSSSDIAKDLFISLHTVKTHRKNILKKSNASNFIQLLNSIDTQL